MSRELQVLGHTLEDLGGGRFRGELNASWYQGRGIFGGLLAGVLLRALERTVADHTRSPRTLTVQFSGPCSAGPIEVRAEVVGAGRYVTHLSARVVQADTVVASALASFGRDREHPIEHREAPMPVVPPAAEVAVRESREAPVFAQHVEFRPCLGKPILSGAAEPRIGGWCRFRDPVPHDAAMVAALLDAWPPPALVMRTAPGRSATIDLTCHFLAPSPLPGAQPGDHYLFDYRSPVIARGYAEQFGELWSGAGELIGRVRQVSAHF